MIQISSLPNAIDVHCFPIEEDSSSTRKLASKPATEHSNTGVLGWIYIRYEHDTVCSMIHTSCSTTKFNLGSCSASHWKFSPIILATKIWPIASSRSGLNVCTTSNWRNAFTRSPVTGCKLNITSHVQHCILGRCCQHHGEACIANCIYVLYIEFESCSVFCIDITKWKEICHFWKGARVN